MTDDVFDSTESSLAIELLTLTRDRATLESLLTDLFGTLHGSVPYTIAALCIPTGPDMVFMADVKEAVSTDAIDELETRARATAACRGETVRIVFGEELVAETHALAPDTVETFSIRAGADSVETDMMLVHGGTPDLDPETCRHAGLICQQTATIASLFCVGQRADELCAELERVTSLNERIMVIAHGISNSLQSVTGYSEMLLIKKVANPEQKHMLELILAGARGIRNQVTEIHAARHAPKKSQS